MHIIGGEFKKRKIIAPKSDLTRPSKSILRETLFNICAFYIEDAIFLDLFSGSGAIGLEALSRGAKLALFIEKEKKALTSINKNIETFKLEDRARVYSGDVFSLLGKVNKLCDIIFADPPYSRDSKNNETYKLIEYLEKNMLLKPDGKLFLETNKYLPLYDKPLKHLKFIKKRVLGDSQLLEYQHFDKDC